MEHAHCISLGDSSTEKTGAHAHCIRLDETTNNNKLYQSDNKYKNSMNTSHHNDETSNNAVTHHLHIVKTKYKHF
eukprot:5587407-Heterocapsa_arctica.AAC.1